MSQRFSTVVADPPWPMPNSGKWTGRGGNWASYNGSITKIPYPMMGLPEIKALPVADLMAPDAHLYIWTVNRHLEATFDIARAWGAEPAQTLVWCKAPMGLGMGGAYVSTTEFVIFARRGKLRTATRQDSSWWQWKRRKHSSKPPAFLDMVERVSPGPYLELFAREKRSGWDCWGNEIEGTIELPRSMSR